MKRVQCPACASKGGDTKGDNLAVFDDGHKHCFACGYHEDGGVKSFKSKSVEFNPPASAPAGNIPNHTFIHEKVLKYYGVRCRLYTRNGVDRPVPTTVYYNYFNKENLLVGTKVRDYKASKEHGIVWHGGSTVTLFGLNRLKGRNVLYLTEGEPDALALAHASRCQLDILGIAGASHTGKLKQFKHIIDNYAKIVCLFDPDEAGELAFLATCDILPEYKLWKAELELDVCDTYEKLGSEALIKAVSKAVKVGTSYLISDRELEREYVKHLLGNNYTGYSTGYRGLDKMLGGDLKPSEVLLFVAHSGRGKSTVVLGMCYNMAHISNAKVLWVSTEMLYVNMVHKALECDLGTILSYQDGKLNVSSEELEDSLNFISNHFTFYTGEMDINSIEEAVYEAINVQDINVLVIDVLNDIEGITDWKKSSDIMKTINRVANGNLRDKRKPIAVILVAHTVKRDGKYANNISLSDISGGGQFIRRSTCIIAMNGDLDSKRRYLSTLKMPRMGVAEESECELVYNIQERFYDEVRM